MLLKYIQAALRNAIEDDGTFYGEIPEFQGVWANAETLEDCRDELAEVLEEWIFLRISDKLPLPVVDGIKLSVEKVS